MQKLKPSGIWLTVDAVIFVIDESHTKSRSRQGRKSKGPRRGYFVRDENKLKVLLIKRRGKPFGNYWSLPGGFIGKNETAHRATERILLQKAGFSDGYLEQLFTFDDPNRDPRGRVISVTYFALVPRQFIKPSKKLDRTIGLFPVERLPLLAFDHKKIVRYAIGRLHAKLKYTNVVYSLLPEYFTLGQLQKTYEIIFGRKLDKRNFRKKFLLLGLIKPTRKLLTDHHRRPARLYRFTSRRPTELKKFF